MSPSQLSIATSAMRRLLKEEASYRKEQIGQEMRLAELQKIPPGSDENWEFRVRQETQALQQTKSIFAPLRQKIADAATSLEGLIEYEDSHPSASEDVIKELMLARETLALAKDGTTEDAKLYQYQ